MISKSQFDLAKLSSATSRVMMAEAEKQFFEDGGLVTRKEMDGTIKYLDQRGNPVKVVGPPD